MVLGLQCRWVTSNLSVSTGVVSGDFRVNAARLCCFNGFFEGNFRRTTYGRRVPSTLRLLPGINRRLQDLDHLNDRRRRLLIFQGGKACVRQRACRTRVVLRRVVAHRVGELMKLSTGKIARLACRFVDLFRCGVHGTYRNNELCKDSILLPSENDRLVVVGTNTRTLPENARPKERLRTRGLIVNGRGSFKDLNGRNRVRLLDVTIRARVRSAKIRPSSAVMTQARVVGVASGVVT